MGQNGSPGSKKICRQAVKICPQSPCQTEHQVFSSRFHWNPMEIDPSKMSAMNRSTDSESEIFHGALEDASSLPIEPTIKQFQQNSKSSIPLFLDYSSMFDPMGLQQLQENYSF
eukprot:scaffold113565_cov33-Attheya_sp.AAC.2